MKTPTPGLHWLLLLYCIPYSILIGTSLKRPRIHMLLCRMVPAFATLHTTSGYHTYA